MPTCKFTDRECAPPGQRCVGTYASVHTSRECALSGSVVCDDWGDHYGYHCRLNAAERARFAMVTAMGGDPCSTISPQEKHSISLREYRVIDGDECRAICGPKFLFPCRAD